MRLFWRSLRAALALPFVVAVVVPVAIVAAVWRISPMCLFPIGFVPMAFGAMILWSCVRVFAGEGLGTLAPWDPPKRFVVGGLYRWVRNPMYIGVILILIGWAVCWQSILLTVYAISVAVCFHIRVVYVEEPRLRARFGEAYDVYTGKVRRWIPRIRPMY